VQLRIRRGSMPRKNDYPELHPAFFDFAFRLFFLSSLFFPLLGRRRGVSLNPNQRGKTNEKQSQKKQENKKSKCKHRGEVIEASIEPSTFPAFFDFAFRLFFLSSLFFPLLGRRRGVSLNPNQSKVKKSRKTKKASANTGGKSLRHQLNRAP
jgi:hypothetical protein